MFPEDAGFHSAIVNLARTSRRPLILTSERPLSFLQSLRPPPHEVRAERPTVEAVVAALRTDTAADRDDDYVLATLGRNLPTIC